MKQRCFISHPIVENLRCFTEVWSFCVFVCIQATKKRRNFKINKISVRMFVTEISKSKKYVTTPPQYISMQVLTKPNLITTYYPNTVGKGRSSKSSVVEPRNAQWDFMEFCNFLTITLSHYYSVKTINFEYVHNLLYN